MPAAIFSIPLPPDYRAAEILEFHARDRTELAEVVSGSTLRKGVMFGAAPVVLSVTLTPTRAEWSADTSATLPPLPRLQRALSGLLGLDSATGEFEAHVSPADPLAQLISRQRGLRVPQTATPFEALSWGIMGQQISVAAAVSLRSSLIQLAGTRHESGLWCYPAATEVASLTVEQLRSNKFSLAKAETLLRLARLVVAGELPLEEWHALPPAELDVQHVSRALQAVKGIGPWTVNYALLRGFAWPDCQLQGDVAIRRALQQQLKLDERPTQEETRALLAHYAPHRSLASAHLWASLSLAA